MVWRGGARQGSLLRHRVCLSAVDWRKPPTRHNRVGAAFVDPLGFLSPIKRNRQLTRSLNAPSESLCTPLAESRWVRWPSTSRRPSRALLGMSKVLNPSTVSRSRKLGLLLRTAFDVTVTPHPCVFLSRPVGRDSRRSRRSPRAARSDAREDHPVEGKKKKCTSEIALFAAIFVSKQNRCQILTFAKDDRNKFTAFRTKETRINSE